MSDHVSQFWDDKLGITESLQKSIQAENQQAEQDFEESQLNENSFNTEQVIDSCRESLDFLAAVAMPTVYRFSFPSVLIAAWQLLRQVEGDLVRRFHQLALGIPRGHAKTTLIKLFILYCILFTKRRFILILGATEDHSVNILSDVVDMLNEVNIIRVFGDWKFARETNNATVKKFVFRGRPIVLGAIGQGGSVRGLNLKNERPDVMVFDDIQTKECSESQQMSDSLMRWMIGTAMKAKSPRGCLFIFAGNMYPGPNSILKKLKSNPTWTKFISGAILADGTALWPDLRSLPDLIEELDNDIAMGHPEIFFSEVLNDTEAGINNKTDLSSIKPWPWPEHEKPQGKFIIIDPSANKKGGDAVAIGYFEVYDGKPALRRVLEEKLSPGNTIRKALLIALQTNTRLIAVESNAYQSTLLYWFDIVAQQLNLTGFHFVEIHSGNASKNARITDALKSLTQSEIIIHDDVRAVVTSQIANWNPLKRDNVDNVLDLVAYCNKVLELYGPMMITDIETMIIEADVGDIPEYNHAF